MENEALEAEEADPKYATVAHTDTPNVSMGERATS